MVGLHRLFVSGLVAAALVLAGPASARQEAPRWSASWASAQMVAEGDNALPSDPGDITLRQIVRLSAGGSWLRVRVSNRFGTEPLRIGAGHVARAVAAGQPGLQPESGRRLTFADQASIVVPAGAEFVSDPVDLAVEAGTDLAVSLHVPDLPARQTGHPGARATTFVAPGNQSTVLTLQQATTTTRWYLLSAVDVEAETPAVIALFGDSITDGYGVLPDTNQRWSDHLASRLRAAPGLGNAAVINLGIGGNRILRDGLGPNAAARFDRDVLNQSGVTHVVILEGVNDLGVLTREAPAPPEAHAAIVRDLTAAYAQMVARARERGIVAIGATIMPFAGSAYYHPGPETEADRQAVNAWIRTPGNFDAVIDFDAITRDPARPEWLDAAFDSGDGLHPSMDGYRMMAAAVSLDLFRPHP
ncbi:MAG: SGNH/GDSL hydrolase family protein [Brevundimonas sp.]|uniref:SGNH/GDSL hydrolase family protein n=1 Tax=Brevundimonas sp. TaxID=1871086 RepID=UPI0027371C70|nr:SGNH/GDSL hydrolase family protein [Brevundimonas sp.]MDP3404165.1 SGNH/GDSL hydrolase family protein [Brevundimonas sp.]